MLFRSDLGRLLPGAATARSCSALAVHPDGGLYALFTTADPAARAKAAYHAAADTYDHPALAFWDRFGREAIERRIDVEWDRSGEGPSAPRYTVKLTMEVEDRKGVLAEVSAKIAEINTNITNLEARTDLGRNAQIDVSVEIADLKHLEKVMKALRSVKGVVGVERAASAAAR